MNSAVMLLENTAKKFPLKTALVYEDEHITFRELRERAVSAATGVMRASGAGSALKKPVVVYLPKSINSIICFAGIMYSGNIYVPVDFNIPMQRLEKIIENLNPLYIITNEDGRRAILEKSGIPTEILLYEELLLNVPDETAVYKALSMVIDTDPVYIMYTSGSTGVPKGVVIPHAGVIDYAGWVVTTFGIGHETVMGNQSAFYFDNSVLDIYSCFRSGATMVIIPEALFMYPNKLPEYLNDKKINFIFWVPTVMINVANSGALERCRLQYVTKVLFCGEAMPNQQLNVWRKTHPHILYANLYGPTEITDVCTYYIVDREFSNSDPLPIGRPCENMDALILTEQGTAASDGEIGELCIMGTGLALGYWNARELTDKVFVQNPLNDKFRQIIYKTGDLATLSPDGLIMYLGRKDSQIKLKGNRIELGDIETAAKSLDGIGNACVLFDSGAQEIVLFAETQEPLKLRQVNMKLKELIPSYMLPARLILMERLPLTPNGKIDRVGLRGTM